MGQIIVLDRNMVNMIAAGEVIERPASVVKELMENSIDAGATNIAVTAEDGGRKLMSVADNGCGMDAEDLARAFEAHTTSKIRTSEDLRRISTLGFRGEALASIASVSQVRAVSRVRDELAASSIEIDCGEKGELSPCSADYGATIQARDLFYKLPARRKFLKTANTEMTHISEQFTRIALAHDELDMTLVHNGRQLYRLGAGRGIRPRIAELFSAEISEGLLETESDEKGLHIFALLGRPEIARSSGKLQYVFLNSRFIRDKFILHAIKEAYRGSIEPNKFPVVFLFIEMPAADYDVNVHPTKMEVRFYNANLVHSQILGCLREKLLATNLDIPAKLPGVPAAATKPDGKIADAMAEFFKRHRPDQAQRRLEFRPAKGAERLPGRIGHFPGRIDGPAAQRSFIQIHEAFIVAEADDGFVIIDQHALHERIMYEDLHRRIRQGKLESQKLLIPAGFRLTEAQLNALENNAALIEQLGIELTAFGPRTQAIQAFPSLLTGVEPVEFVRELLDLLGERDATADANGLLDKVLNMAACKAAIKAGQKLSDGEIEQLLSDKEAIEHSSRCPHGRPTAIRFTISELERQFKRK